MLHIHGLLTFLINDKQAKLQCNIFCLFLGEELKCYSCHSNKSWSHCESTRKQQHCDRGVKEDTCIKLHRLKIEDEKETHYYSKGCVPSSLCSGEECKEHGQGCRVDCCNTEYCNGSVFLNANYMTILMLAMVIVAR